MRQLIIIAYLSLIQAERFGFNYRSVGSHNAFDNRSRHRGSSAFISTPAITNTNAVGAEVNSGRTKHIQTPVDTNYNKEFYSYSASEDDFKDMEATQHLASALRKNIRVVFIKAPENNDLTTTAFQLAQRNAESKTAIYVLTKQPGLDDFANQLQNIQKSEAAKPAVHFVKYRTPEDAVRAQQTIKNEFDALAGSSRLTSEDVATVLDFSSRTENVATKSDDNRNIYPTNGFASHLNALLRSKN